MRRQAAVLLLALVLAVPLAAQRDRTGRGTPGEPNAIGVRDIQRAQDELNALRLAEARAAEKPLRSARLKDAIRDFNAADYKVAPLHVDYGQFVTVTGYTFLAMHLAPSQEAKLPEDGKVTFFASLVDDGGKVVWSREEPVELTRDATGARWYEQSVLVPPSNAQATFGLAVKDQPVAMAAMPVRLTKLDRLERRLSRLIVSNHVAPMEKAQAADAPFAFGGIKVVPKGDRTFRKSDELWVFYEAQNPGVDEAGAPKLTTKVQLEAGEGGQGAKILRGIAADAEPLPLKGTPGRFGVGTVVNLSRVAPGPYLVRVQVKDAIAGVDYELVDRVVVVE